MLWIKVRGWKIYNMLSARFAAELLRPFNPVLPLHESREQITNTADMSGLRSRLNKNKTALYYAKHKPFVKFLESG